MKQRTKDTIIALSLIGLYGLFLAGAFCVFSIFLISNSRVPLPFLPTPTIDLACEDASCLRMCLGRIPDFSTRQLSKEDASWLDNVDEITLVKYEWNDQGNGLDETYTRIVPDYLIPFQEEVEVHQRLGEYTSMLVPIDKELHFSQMDIEADANSNGLAVTTWESDQGWILEMNILNTDTANHVTNDLIHSYGHMLTLNNIQVYHISKEYAVNGDDWDDYEKTRQACGNFLVGQNCAYENSYLDQFGQRFWTEEIYNAWVGVYLAKEGSDEASVLHNIYFKYPDQFVSIYAAIDPEEDIAESWQVFVMQPKPTGDTIADQKVLFFYEFPELVQRRREIIQAVCKYAADHE